MEAMTSNSINMLLDHFGSTGNEGLSNTDANATLMLLWSTIGEIAQVSKAIPPLLEILTVAWEGMKMMKIDMLTLRQWEYQLQEGEIPLKWAIKELNNCITSIDSDSKN